MSSAPTWESINDAIDRQYPKVKNIQVDSLKTLLDQGVAPVLIDVRNNDEFAVSHLPGALHITDTGSVIFPKTTPIVVYCSVGVRSAAFAEALRQKGYSDVRNLRGSIFLWANRGFPLRQGTKTVAKVHPYNEKWGALLNSELRSYHP